MLEFSGEAFCRLSSMMGQLIVVLERGGIPDAKVVGASLGELDREAEKLQLRSVVQQLARVKAHILNGSANSSSLHPMIMELYNRMRDIMEDRLLLAIEPSRADLYRQESPLFGSETAEKFPSIAYDIEEAGKCLALDRSTASAFHAIAWKPDYERYRAALEFPIRLREAIGVGPIYYGLSRPRWTSDGPIHRIA